ncbi:MAG: hypothetical protein K5886_04890 [Lachnospiraceae bacterium]|nr:hypothetical protein [Lachnospiraceae bacterium]
MVKKALMIIFALSVVLAGCAGKQPAEEQNNYIGNPWIDCATLEDAEKIAGFDIMVPDRIEGYPDTLIQAVDKDMIQVFYFDGSVNEEERSRVLIRKGIGNEDISGDYNVYSQNETVEMHGVNVDIKGNDGLIYNATWYQDGYAYAILPEDGMTKDLIEFFVETVK